jgi:hypothetical protein
MRYATAAASFEIILRGHMTIQHIYVVILRIMCDNLIFIHFKNVAVVIYITVLKCGRWR